MISFFKKTPKYWKDLEVPAKLFFEIIEGGDHNLLIIQGKPKESDLINAWDNIFDLFFSEKDSLELKLILETQARVKILEYRVLMYEMFVEIIKQNAYNVIVVRKWVKKFKENKIRLRINEKKPIKQEIYRIQRQIIPALVTDLEIEVENLKNLTKGEKAKFYEILASMSTKFHIPDTISLAMFLGYEKSLTKK